MKTVQPVNCFTAHHTAVLTSKPMEPGQAAALLEACESRPCRNCRQLWFYKRAFIAAVSFLIGYAVLPNIVGFLTR